MGKLEKRLSSSQIIILGFAMVILLGSLILTLPFATRTGQPTAWTDALFTATSAVCVTGLVVHDTATYWSEFGQATILLLIQIGGMGVVTIVIAFSTLLGKKITLKQRSTMQEAISAPQVGGIVMLTSFIIKMTALFELTGALLMYPVFYKEVGPVKGIWYAIFHSISAFCNAGFDLMGFRSPFSSLTHFESHPIINFTIMALIIIGGIGFITWSDFFIYKFKFRKYRMQSKVVIITTTLLILIPAVYFFFFEFKEGHVSSRFWISLFQSVTPRTAGFNTTDLSRMTETGLAVIIILMLIGGSPGSTAGGMKTTTLAVLISTTFSVFKRKDQTHFFGRRVSDETIKHAAAVLMMYLNLFLFGGFIISRIEGLPLISCLFETASAVGTVGLSLGITTQLGLFSKLILIFLMYLGRAGGLTLIFSTFASGQSTARLPQEKLTVG